MDDLIMDNIYVVGLAAVVLLILIWNSLRIVRQYQRLVVFRLGRSIGPAGPGPVWLWPFIDQASWVDLREQFLEVGSQTTITRDNAPIAVDFLVYWRVLDPENSVVAVADFAGASRGIATTTLRAVIGDIPLDDVLSKRDQINQILQTKLDEVTERWGVKVTAVEIREITPPRDIQDAMNRQMAAERYRRATVIEAEGSRQAAVTVAEGEKTAAILAAEGDRQAAILRAEGFSLALGQIYNIARTVDERTMMLQYFETLKAMGEGQATKFIFPLEFTSMLQGFARTVGGTLGGGMSGGDSNGDNNNNNAGTGSTT